MSHAIVFDFDGVLADSEPLHLRAYQEVLTPLGITLTRDESYARLLGYDDMGVLTRVGEAAGRAFEARQISALIADKARVFDALVASVDVLYPGAAECVARMAAAYPLAVASGALKGEILAVLRHADLEGHFRFIVSAEDTPRSKPAPESLSSGRGTARAAACLLPGHRGFALGHRVGGHRRPALRRHHPHVPGRRAARGHWGHPWPLGIHGRVRGEGPDPERLTRPEWSAAGTFVT